MPSPTETTGNMMQDLMSQDPEVSNLVDALGASDPAVSEQARILIVGADHRSAVMAQNRAEIARLKSAAGGDVVFVDSIPEELRDSQLGIIEPQRRYTGNPVSLRRRKLLMDDLHIGPISMSALADAPLPKKQPPAPKEKTLADFQAIVKAQAKRERKAAKLRGRK